MALTRPTLTQISTFAILLFVLCCKTNSSHTPPTHAPSNSKKNSSHTNSHTHTHTHTPSPAPTPDAASPISISEHLDTNDETDTDTHSPTLAPDDAASPISTSEHFELSLPKFGVQKASVSPKNEGAKVSNKQLEGIEHKIDEFKSTLTKRLADPKTPESSKKCLAECQENFEDAIDGVKISIESINNQDLPKANIDISGIATDIETCNDCFKDTDGEDKEINAFNEWIKGVTKECLDNLKKI